MGILCWNTDRIRRLVTISGVSLLLAGCGSDKKPKELANLVPVKGKVTFQGEAPHGAVVTLFPSNSGAEFKPGMATGIVDSQGNFVVNTTISKYYAPGAAPGEYRLAISWPVSAPTKLDPEATKERLPSRYLDPTTSGLLVVVARGSTQLDELQLQP